VSNRTFFVSVADLERGPRSVSWPLTRAWLGGALADTDATPLEDGQLDVTLTKSGRDVLVRGRLRARVSMPDSRTLEPVELELAPELFLMLSPACPPEAARRRSRGKGKGRAPAGRDEPPTAQRKGKSRGWPEDPELSDGDAAADTYDGEEVLLDRFVREFILLELPMVAHKDLRSAPPPAIGPLPPAADEQQERVDPRLAPLAAIADRLRGRKD
jgi:DUF177 domain-containing protein